MRLGPRILLGAALFLPSWSLGAETLRLDLDPDATEIVFTLDATGHVVEGELVLKSGRVVFDLESRAASGSLLIDAALTNTGNEKRDRKMHEQVLRSALHPAIRFDARSIQGLLPAENENATSRLTLAGDIELLGRSHAVELPIRVLRRGSDLVVSTEFLVPYVEWGLSDPSVFVLRVAKVVDVSVRSVGRLTREEPLAADPGPEVSN